MLASDDWQVPGSSLDIYVDVFGPAMMAAWAPIALELAEPQPEDRVLDVACGPGVLTRLLASSIGPSGRVVGLDLAPEMLAAARRTAPNPSGAAIEWREADATAIPFENESFDVVVSAFGLMLFSDAAAALSEMHRILASDGRLAATVWGSINRCPGQLAMRESWERHFGRHGASLFYRQHSLGDPAKVRSLVQDAGFAQVSVSAAMGAVRLASAEQLARSYGAMVGVEADESTRREVIDEVSGALKSYVGAEGLEYPIEALLVTARK